MPELQKLKSKPGSAAQHLGAVVAHWPQATVPDPNPYFPPAPREGSLAVSVVFVLATLAHLALVGVVVYAIGFVPDPDMNWFFVPLMLGLPLLGLAIYTYPMHRNVVLWRSGRVLPARVLDVRVGFIENAGLDPQIGKAFAIIAGVVGGPIVLALAVVIILLGSTRLQLEWVDEGHRHTGTIFMGFDGCALGVGQTIWVLKRRGKPRPAMFAASWSQKVHRVPREVVGWLDFALETAPEKKSD